MRYQIYAQIKIHVQISENSPGLRMITRKQWSNRGLFVRASSSRGLGMSMTVRTLFAPLPRQGRGVQFA